MDSDCMRLSLAPGCVHVAACAVGRQVSAAVVLMHVQSRVLGRTPLGTMHMDITALTAMKECG